KKSRRLVTLAVTSSVYGNVEIATPAIKAPISRDNPSSLARPERRKHQESAPTRTNSGRRATALNNGGRTYRLATNEISTSAATFPNERAINKAEGFFNSG